MQSPTMKAIVQDVYGGPDVLYRAEVPRPTPGSQDLLVRVAAVAINPVDSKVRRGGKAGEPVPDAPKILGWDAAGVVEAVGEDVSLFAVGDEVFFAGDIGRPGSYAEYVAVDERIVGRKPRTLGYEEAAAIPLTALTAWEALAENMGIAPDGIPQDSISQDSVPKEAWLLIVGGAGGVGSIAIQIAKKLCRVYVAATASRPESTQRCTDLGADIVLDHSQPLAPQMQAAGLVGFDFIFTTATLDNFADLASVLNPLGHICAIQGGPAAESVNVGLLMGKRGIFSYELMFTRPATGVEPEKQGQILNRVADLIDDGTLQTTLHRTLSWDDVQDAHREIDTEHTMGKIVMTVDG
jgi:NADPH2:quinone reductase